MRCLGIDYGRRRIGLALSDPTLLIATPLVIIENRGIKKTVLQILDIIQKNDVKQIATLCCKPVNCLMSCSNFLIRSGSTAEILLTP